MAGRSPLLPLLLGTLLVKVMVVAHLYDHPLLQPAGELDSGVYARLAASVAGGDVLLRGEGPYPFFVSPLYVYFLAGIHVVSGGSLLAAEVIQALLGTAAVGLIYGMGRRLFGPTAALIGAVLFALTGVVTFHEVLILQAALDPFLTALVLYLVVRALSGEARPALGFGFAGLALGILALNRPNVLPWAAVLVVLLTFARGRREGTRLAGAMAFGCALAISPAALRNLVVSGEPVLVSSHGGLNFLVGNGPGANGVYRRLEGITPSIAGQAADARKVAEAAAGRPLSTREVSRHFMKTAWAWIASQPAAAGRLFAKKVWYVLSGDEAPLNFSYPWYRGRSAILTLLVVGPWLLVPLGGAGLVLAFVGAARLERRDLLVWASFVPAYVLLVAAFFVATRYRLPLYVPLAAAAGNAVAAILGTLPGRERTRRLALAGVIAAPLAVLSLWPTGLYDGAADEETLWVIHLIDSGEAAKFGEAARLAEALAPRHPDPGQLWYRVGQAWSEAGRVDEAVSALSRAIASARHPPEAERSLAAIHERRGIERTLAGDAAAALQDLEAAVRLDSQSASARLNLAAVLAERGDLRRARDLAAEALRLQPGYGKAEALLRALPK